MRKLGFTLVELLVVVALVAIIGAGVAVTYGRKIVDDANYRMTLHEQGQLREAFTKFYADNGRVLSGNLKDTDKDLLPTSNFKNTFTESKAKDYIDRHPTRYGMLELLERYGLWCLLRPEAAEKKNGTKRETFVNFPVFNPDIGEGWQGPYLRSDSIRPYYEKSFTDGLLPDAAATDASSQYAKGDLIFPQLGHRLTDTGIYWIVYFEHCVDRNDTKEPVYRRLLLISGRNDSMLDTPEKRRLFAGNQRKRPNDTVSKAILEANDAYPLDLSTGRILPADDTYGFFITELMNLDSWER